MAGSAGRTIYQATNGRVNLGAIQNSNSGAEAAVKAGVQVATSGAKTEENYFYDNKMRVQRTAAVMSLVTSNYADTRAVQKYHSIDMSSTNPGSTGISNKEWMDRIGLGHAADNAAVNFVNSQTFTTSYNIRGNEISNMCSYLSTHANESFESLANNGTCIVDMGNGHTATLEIGDKTKLAGLKDAYEKGGNWQAQINSFESISVTENRVGSSFGGFSNDQKSQLAASGSFQTRGAKFTDRNVDFKVDTLTGRNQTSKMFSAARTEDGNRAFVTDRNGARNSREAMAMIHDKSVEYLNANCKDAGVTFGSGDVRKQYAQAQANLDAKIASLRKAGGSPTEIANLQNQKKMIAKAGEGFTEGARRGGLTGTQRYGLRVLGSEVVGRDMMLGIDVYANTARLTTAAVRNVYRGYLRTTGHLLTGELVIPDKVKNGVGKFVNAHGIHVPEPLKTIGNGLNSAGEHQKKKLDRLKAKDQARKSGSLRQWKNEDRAARATARNERRVERINRRENKAADLRRRATTTGGNRALHMERRANRLDRINKRSSAVSGFVEGLNKRLNGLSEGTRELWGKVTKPFKNVWKKMTTPFDFVANKLDVVKTFIKKKILTPIIIGVGIPSLVILLLMFIVPLMAFFVLHFVSEVPLPSDALGQALHGEYLNSDGQVNYIQLIVDETAMDMGEVLTDTLKRDARTYFLKTEAKNFFTGKARDNRVPTYSDSQIAAKSKGGNEYEGVFVWWRDADDPEVGEFYATEEANLPDESKTPVSGVNANLLPIVSMMHVRYFDDIDFKGWNTARAYVYYMYAMSHSVSSYTYKEIDFCSDDALFEDGYRVPSFGETKSDVQYHLMHQECSNVFIHGYTENHGKLINEARVTTINLVSKAGRLLLGDKWKDVSKDFNGIGVFTNELPYQEVNGKKYICDHYMTISHSNPTYGYLCGDVNTDFCKLQEDLDHTIGEWTTDTTVPEANTWTTTTNPNYHEHDDDCYDTIYVCLGHCGGHITPVVNTQMYMEFENLATQDFFKVTRDIQSSEIDNSKLRSEIVGFTNLNQWKTYWAKKAANEWFTPFPTTSAAVAEWCFKGTVNVLDESVAFWKTILTGGSEKDALDSMDLKKDKPLDSDMFDFHGWFAKGPDGEQIAKADGSMDIDQALMDEMHAFYGNWKDEKGNLVDYDIGTELWDNFDVHFPIGGKVLSTRQKQLIKEYLLKSGVSEDSKQMLVISEAMDRCGSFYYDLTGAAHQNGIHNIKGKSDCSGFVCGVLNRSIGTNLDQSAAAFGNNGGRKRGSVISHANGGTGKNGVSYSGHVMIYVGYLDGEAAFDGEGEYVIDCSSSVGGSSMRKMTSSKLAEYNRSYNY